MVYFVCYNKIECTWQDNTIPTVQTGVSEVHGSSERVPRPTNYLYVHVPCFCSEGCIYLGDNYIVTCLDITDKNSISGEKSMYT